MKHINAYFGREKHGIHSEPPEELNNLLAVSEGNVEGNITREYQFKSEQFLSILKVKKFNELVVFIISVCRKYRFCQNESRRDNEKIFYFCYKYSKSSQFRTKTFIVW